MMTPAATMRPSSVLPAGLDAAARTFGRRRAEGEDRHCGEPTGAHRPGGGAGEVPGPGCCLPRRGRMNPGVPGPTPGYDVPTMTRCRPRDRRHTGVRP